MPRPTKNPDSGIYYFRQKTPADLVKVFGKAQVGWSLRTKDPEEAKGLCCTNPVRDSSCESIVVAGRHEQTHIPNLQDQELVGLQ